MNKISDYLVVTVSNRLRAADYSPFITQYIPTSQFHGPKPLDRREGYTELGALRKREFRFTTFF
jgi:hypothetical protein